MQQKGSALGGGQGVQALKQLLARRAPMGLVFRPRLSADQGVLHPGSRVGSRRVIGQRFQAALSSRQAQAVQTQVVGNGKGPGFPVATFRVKTFTRVHDAQPAVLKDFIGLRRQAQSQHSAHKPEQPALMPGVQRVKCCDAAGCIVLHQLFVAHGGEGHVGIVTLLVRRNVGLGVKDLQIICELFNPIRAPRPYKLHQYLERTT